MIRWFVIACVLMGTIISCGPTDVVPSATQIATQAGQSLTDETQVFNEGSMIDLSADSSIESFEAISKLQVQCGRQSESQDEMECDESSSIVTHDQLEIAAGRILLKKEGDYLCRIKLKGQSGDKIIRLKVAKPEPVKEEKAIQDFKMVHHKVHGENMVYQFKLMPLSKDVPLEKMLILTNTHVEWKVEGGKSEFIETELKYSTKLHMLTRTIRFLDKAEYTISAVIHMSREQEFKVSDVVDLRTVEITPVPEPTTLSVGFNLDRDVYKVGETVQLKGIIKVLEGPIGYEDMPEEHFSYHWKVTSLKSIQCPTAISELEDVRMKGVADRMELMCGKEVESDSEDGKLFELTDGNKRDAQVIYYKKGTYVIEFSVAHEGVILKSEKKISVSNGLVYERDYKKYRVEAYTKWVEESDADDSLTAEICGTLRFGGDSMPETVLPAGRFRYEWHFQDPELKPLRRYFSNGSCLLVSAPKEGAYKAHVTVFKEYDDIVYFKAPDHPTDIIVVDRQEMNVEIQKPFYNVTIDRVKARPISHLGKGYIGAKIRVRVYLRGGSYSPGPYPMPAMSGQGMEVESISYTRKDVDTELVSVMPVNDNQPMFDDQNYRPDYHSYERYRFEVKMEDDKVIWLRHVDMTDFYLQYQWIGRFGFPEAGLYKVSVKVFCKKGDKPEKLVHDTLHEIWIQDGGDGNID